QRQHIAQGLRRKDSLPDRIEIPDALLKAFPHALGVRRRARLRFGRRPHKGNRFRPRALEPEHFVPLGDGEKRAGGAPYDLAERRWLSRSEEHTAELQS